MKSDIEIAQEAKMLKITEVAKEIGLTEDDLELYGKYKAKISFEAIKRASENKDGKLILVTAINPTPAGEGKTTTTVGIGQAMKKINKRAIIALREPSLGPCMGMKGGAAGGGYAQVVPMEDINLHFTGDIHAITAANNFIASVIDNHIYQGNELNIDPKRVTWKRVVDLNDRALRNIVIGMGRRVDGVVREDGFMITVASEIMAILCLADSITDLKNRIGNIIIGYTYQDKPVTVADLGIQGAVTTFLKEAIKPNLVQTLDNTPAIIHGGPFANIAHGCNSIIATKFALKVADYVITEAGFGADLGAEKFLDIKCPAAGIKPSAIVIVATVRALKYNGGIAKNELKVENVDAVKKGVVNLEKHIENMKLYGVPVVVAINRFAEDSEAEINVIRESCNNLSVDVEDSEVFAKGADGAISLASKLVSLCEKNSEFKVLYNREISIKEKIETIAKKIYGAAGVEFSSNAIKKLKKIEDLGLSEFPVCMAKTQYSLSDNPNLLGRPEGFIVNVRDLNISAGAGFIVALTGDIMTMPGLPKKPAALNIDVDENGVVSGLF